MEVKKKSPNLALAPSANSGERDLFFDTSNNDTLSYKDETGAIITIGGSFPFKYFVATISQVGTNDPVVDIHVNSLGGVPVFTRDSAGYYSMTLLSAFPAKSTAILTGSTPEPSEGFIPTNISARVDSFDVINIYSFNSNNVAEDGLLTDTTIEIKVFN